jgi:membrane fusion protein (multidrug efflux system)
MNAQAKIPFWKVPRWRWLAIAGSVFSLSGIAYGTYWAAAARHHERTDDAYVNGNIVEITPQISGTVVEIGADDTQFVNAGQALVRLDPADAEVALDEAEAQLARTVREVRNLFATTAQLHAALEVRESELATAQKDLARRERLASSGAISAEELQHARETLRGTQAAVGAAREQLSANLARVDRTTVADHPDVRNAAAGVRSAYLNYARTVLPAPVSGVVAKRNVQLGHRVSPGTPLMSVVPLDQVWVDANFKEPQLARMRVGQGVTVTADLYGRSVRYHGRVIGLGAGTGSVFSLLPAQNATGNWIKIVQRVPVRIGLDAREVALHPLQIGLSMKVDVDVADSSGARLPHVAQNTATYATGVFESSAEVAGARVRAIIVGNEANDTRAGHERLAVIPARHRLSEAARAAEPAPGGDGGSSPSAQPASGVAGPHVAAGS